jgi:hypothetical protein
MFERMDWCVLCNSQFSQDVPGTALVVEYGAVSGGKSVMMFRPEKLGAVHWVCARETWDAEFFRWLWNGRSQKSA